MRAPKSLVPIALPLLWVLCCGVWGIGCSDDNGGADAVKSPETSAFSDTTAADGDGKDSAELLDVGPGEDVLSDTSTGPDSSAADVADASSLTDAKGSNDATDTTAADALQDVVADTVSDTSAPDAAVAKICPGPDAPQADIDAGDVPQPDVAGCKWGNPDFFKGAKPPAPSIEVELGQVTATGEFVPLKDGDWVPMVHGIQGGFHVFAAFRFKLPGVTDPTLKVQAEPRLYRGCDLVGFGIAPVVYVKPNGAQYQFGSKVNAGIQVRFGVPGAGEELKSELSLDSCNEWHEFRLAVRDMKTGKWGQTHVQVRTYDTK